MIILPIASGKGGVGKSLIATNLSIALAETGKNVCLVDLDLGGSNLHTLLGMRSITKGIGTFLNSTKKNFDELIVKTNYNGLLFIPGDTEIPGIANLSNSQKNILLKRLLELQVDFLVLDLGAGTSNNVVDFFLISGRGIIVATPLVTSILNAYLFLKNAVFRIMVTSFKRKSEATKYMEELKKEGTPLQKLYFPQLLEKIQKIDPDSYNEFSKRVSTFKPCLIFNLLEDAKQSEKARQIKRSAYEYLDLELEHLGVIYRDEFQNIALNSRLPLIKYKSNSIFAEAIYRIADKIYQWKGEDGAPLDIQSLEESYQVADMEARIDFQTKLEYIEELFHCEDFTKGDLIETIKNQQFEIEKLRKENDLIKVKLVNAISQGFLS